MNEVAIFQRPGSVSCDFQGIKNQLEAYCKEYEGIVFTEETKADAKKTVANLRKEQKEWLNRIKEAKTEYMKPWDAFAEQANELARLYDKPICAINGQVEAFDEQRRKDKIDRCKAIYNDFIQEEEIRAYLPFSKVYNVKWENATYTEKSIKDDLMNAKQNVKTGLETITSFKSDVEEQALEVFKQTLDMAEALKVITKYDEAKKIAIEAEKNRMAAEVREEVRAEVTDQVISTLTPVDDGTEAVAYSYTIFLNKDAKEKLDSYMDSVGIEYFSRRENK